MSDSIAEGLSRVVNGDVYDVFLVRGVKRHVAALMQINK